MKTVIFLFVALAMVAGSCSAQTQKEALKPASKEQIRATLREILEATFQRAAHRNPDGTIDSINMVLLHVTDEDRRRVRDFGNAAISVLREYVADNEGWHQQVALELLGEFKSDDALGALVDFAEHSRIRDTAVSYMGSYPIDKTRVTLKKFLSDPDPLVRDAAKRNLAANGEK
jgi:HEAT repeat protein